MSNTLAGLKIRDRRSQQGNTLPESVSLNSLSNSDQFTFLKHLNRTYGSKVTTILKFHSLPMSPKLLTQYQVMSLDFGLTNYPKKCILYIMFVSITVSAT